MCDEAIFPVQRADATDLSHFSTGELLDYAFPVVEPERPVRNFTCCDHPDLVAVDRGESHFCNACETWHNFPDFGLALERDELGNLVPQLRRTGGKYLEIYYFHERMRKLMLCDKPIPEVRLHSIRTAMRNLFPDAPVTKAVVQATLLSMPSRRFSRDFLEQYPRLIWELGGRRPPVVTPGLYRWMDWHFRIVVSAWKSSIRPAWRDHMPDYNFVICRLAEAAGRPDFADYLPFLKTPSKAIQTCRWYTDICRFNGWPLVGLDEPTTLESRLVELHESESLWLPDAGPRSLVGAVRDLIVEHAERIGRLFCEV